MKKHGGVMDSAVIKKDVEVVPVVGVRMNPGKVAGILYGGLSCLAEEFPLKFAALHASFEARKDEHKLVSIEIGARQGPWDPMIRQFKPAGPADPYRVVVTTLDYKGVIL